MSAEFEAEVSSGLKGLEVHVKALDRAVQQLDHNLGRVGKNVQTSFKGAQKEAKSLKDRWHELNEEGGHIGHALHHLGPLGEALSHVLGQGNGMTGGIGRIAAVAGIAGFALEAFSKVINAQVERVKAAAEAHKEYRDAVLAGIKAQNSQAVGALSQRKEIANLAALGGKGAVDEADALARGGVVDASSARKGIAEAYKISDKQTRGRAIKAALEVASNGGDFAKALHDIQGSKRFQRMLNPDYNSGSGTLVDLVSQGQDSVSGRIFAEENGIKHTKDYAGLSKRLREGRGQESKFLDSADTTQGILNQKDVVARDQLVKFGERAAREELSRFTEPIAAALGELNRTRQEELDVLRKMAAAQGTFGSILENLKLLVGAGQGSAELQLRQKNVAIDNGTDYGEGG